MAYERLEPFSDEVMRYMLAQIVVAIYKTAGSKKKLKPEDFMPKYKERAEQTPQEIFKAFKEYFRNGNTGNTGS